MIALVGEIMATRRKHCDALIAGKQIYEQRLSLEDATIQVLDLLP